MSGVTGEVSMGYNGTEVHVWLLKYERSAVHGHPHPTFGGALPHEVRMAQKKLHLHHVGGAFTL